MTWATHLPVRAVRIARPTNQLEKIATFYRDVVGLPELGRFEKHEGYSGVMIGLPDISYHLELVSHEDGIPNIAPTREDFLVFYIDDQAAIEALVERLASHGYTPVEPENLYWAFGGVTYEDPDGYGLIFMNMQEHQRLLQSR